MTRFFTAILLGLPGMAVAHPGHLAELAGHGHWLGAAALGAAIALGALAAKGRGAKSDEGQIEEDQDPPNDDDLQEA